MSLPSLYQLSGEYREVLRLLAEANPEDHSHLEAVEGTLNAISDEIKIKAPAVAAGVLEIEALADAADEAVERMAKRAKAIRKRAQYLRAYLVNNLMPLPEKEQKIETPEMTVCLRRNPSAIEIEQSEDLPDAYRRDPPKVEVQTPVYRALLEVVHAVAKYDATPFDDDSALLEASNGVTRAMIALKKLSLPNIERTADKKAIADYYRMTGRYVELKRASEKAPLTPPKQAEFDSLAEAIQKMPVPKGAIYVTSYRVDIK